MLAWGWLGILRLILSNSCDLLAFTLAAIKMIY